MRCLDQTSLATPCEIVLHCASSQTFQSRSNSFYCQLCFLVGQDKDAPHLQTSCWSKGGYPCIVIFGEPPQMSKQGGYSCRCSNCYFQISTRMSHAFLRQPEIWKLPPQDLNIKLLGYKWMDKQTNRVPTYFLTDDCAKNSLKQIFCRKSWFLNLLGSIKHPWKKTRNTLGTLMKNP